ncbi:hypothetical protein [Streptomyces sp. CA-111067]|uniref:hypothetical protein n=1 Tax=Streptomyces sp. CA-111067 TaxID=3240046 RepID=UPI003D9916C6
MRRVATTVTTGALVCACAVVAGCGSTVTGARREGPAPTATMKVPSTVAPAIAADPAALAVMVRKDPGVSETVRDKLTACRDAGYPLATDAGDLTEGDGPDLVVNVTTCGDGIGVAAYVYRMINGKYQHVFDDEQPPVYASVDDGRLEIIHEVYNTDDLATYPSGEESSFWVWRGHQFVQVSRWYSDFGAKTPSSSPEPTSTEPAPTPGADLLDPGVPTVPTTGGATARAVIPPTETPAPRTTTPAPATRTPPAAALTQARGQD